MSGPETRVGVGDAKVARGGVGVLATHALGSCIAVTLYDPEVGVGAMLHAMLPGPPKPGESGERLDVYLSSGFPRLQRAFESAGGRMSRATICAAGGAELIDDRAGFKIGARNWAILRKLCFKQGIRISAQDVGGKQTRNMTLDLSTGDVVVSHGGNKKNIWTGSNVTGRKAS